MIDKENQASIGVATKIGMTYQREVEDEFGWASLYAVSRPGQGERPAPAALEVLVSGMKRATYGLGGTYVERLKFLSP